MGTTGSRYPDSSKTFTTFAGLLRAPGEVSRSSAFARSNWVTRITNLEERCSFTDEQLFGPYKFWHHRHEFNEVDDGVFMKDIVHYKLPFAIITPLIEPYVKKKLTQIFKFRQEVCDKLFSETTITNSKI